VGRASNNDLGFEIRDALMRVWLQYMGYIDPSSTIGPQGDWDLDMLKEMRDAVLKVVEDRELMNMWKGGTNEE
jgi:hypothetical protein